MAMMNMNRQSSDKLKKCTLPAAVVVVLTTILGGLGAGLRYGSDIFTMAACEDGWTSFNGYCYIYAGAAMAMEAAIMRCESMRAHLPIPYYKHAQVVAMTLNKDKFWTGLKMQNATNSWHNVKDMATVADASGKPHHHGVDSNRYKYAPIHQPGKGDCAVSLSGVVMQHHCEDTSVNVVCSRRFYNK
ncbi:EEV protein [Squirrelpox virus]|uniref:C1R n=1 Tax=Squirrelpox virus TaxID=240426 RepID=Q1HTR2_9POXV|nr:EEV protein [Squirrelpox virus]ABD51474.1 C1R [Squirrelpox virus]CCD83306.1 EEV protein [Squirrelpox virus]